MKKYILFLILIPLLSISQSGISLSGLSQFQTGQSILPLSLNTDFNPIKHESRNHQIMLSIFRGRKFKIGTFAVKASIAYNINKIDYDPNKEVLIENFIVNKKSLMPIIEIWHIIFQTQNSFLYTSIGGFGVIEELKIKKPNTNEDSYNYNNIIPFFRTGIQINYGKFFINPFLSFDLQEISFSEIKEINSIDFKSKIKNYTLRSGLEFGIMF